jgi:hypothetical protein
MEPIRSKSQRALLQMIVVVAVAAAAAVAAVLWNGELVRRIYLADEKTTLLNGLILLLFLLGVVQLIRGLRHYAFEEDQVAKFVRNREELFEAGNPLMGLSDKSIIATRYLIVKSLFDRRVPINHSAISSVMVAEESLYQSFPKFVHNVLILTGVFGTIVSLIFALVGASATLQAAVPGEGMGMMLSGMNTALTTTATAIVCFFFFTYFYQKLTDVQTHLFGQIEKAVLIHMIPDFAFDTEAINYKTELLIRELRKMVSELRAGTTFIEESLAGLNKHNLAHLDKMDALLTRQDDQIKTTETMIHHLEGVQGLLKDGFRLKS